MSQRQDNVPGISPHDPNYFAGRDLNAIDSERVPRIGDVWGNVIPVDTRRCSNVGLITLIQRRATSNQHWFNALCLLG